MAIQTQTTGRLPKPELRGYTSRYLRKHVLIALSLGFVSSMAYKFLVAEPRKKRYAEFYRNYDDNATYEKIQNSGWKLEDL